jgi:SAM-dependent methyltransferase
MQGAADNIQKNIEHYNHVYSRLTVDRIVKQVGAFRSNPKGFLEGFWDTSTQVLYKNGFVGRISGKRVLELGCGNGLNPLIMACSGADVIANDISSASEKLIREAASILHLDNIQPISGNFADLPFERHFFDVVVGKAFLHHLTHELEASYLSKIAQILKTEGEAYFCEPAVNNPLLDMVRWMVPVPGRPSIMSRKAFARWKAQDPHPDRDNSSDHFFRIGMMYFKGAQIEPYGSIERFARLMPRGNFRRQYVQWAHRMDAKLPMAFRRKAARAQLVVYRYPRSD